MTSLPLYVVGAGGFGREAAAILKAMGHGPRLVGFVDDSPSGEDLKRVAALGYDVVDSVPGLAARRTSFEAVLAVGSNKARRAIENVLVGAPVTYPVVVHPDTSIGTEVTLGAGTIVAPGVRLSTNITTGRHVHLDQNAVVGHDSVLDDFARVNPNGCVSGSVHVGEDVLVGASATILQGLSVGAGAVIGAGAVVVRDVDAQAVVKGVPAR